MPSFFRVMWDWRFARCFLGVLFVLFVVLGYFWLQIMALAMIYVAVNHIWRGPEGSL